MTLDQGPPKKIKGPETVIVGDTLEKLYDLLWILRNVMDITKIAIVNYYGILQSVISISPPPRLTWRSRAGTVERLKPLKLQLLVWTAKQK